ncbi:cytochrome c biogenesis protein ResB [Verrucomicrobiota bacterium]
MKNNNKNSPSCDGQNDQTNALSRILKGLGSMQFALFVVVLITISCIAGTLHPQGARLYSSPLFVGLLCVFSLTLMNCIIRRFITAIRLKRGMSARTIGSLLTHISIILILAGAVIRIVWGERGYIEFREGESATFFHNDAGRIDLPFRVTLVDFELETFSVQEIVVHWKGQDRTLSFPVKLGAEQVLKSGDGSDDSYSIKILRYVPDFIIDIETKAVKSRSQEPLNPAIEVEITGGAHSGITRWLFAKYPESTMHGREGLPFDMRYLGPIPNQPQQGIKDFKSTLQIFEGETVVKEKTIEVNSPLSWKGYTLYQANFRPSDLSWTALQVVYDPGVPVVYSGFIFMIVGLIMVFYVSRP